MHRTQGIYLTFSRLLKSKRFEEWADWYDNVHLADITGSGAAWRVTRWERIDPPRMGYTNVNIYEIEGPDILANQRKSVAAGHTFRRFDGYAVMDLQIYRAFGRWDRIADPSPGQRGRALIRSMCNDPRAFQECAEWADNVHALDLLKVDGVTGLTRWELAEPRIFGANHLTLLELGDDPDRVAEGITAKLTGLMAESLLHPNYCITDLVVLKATGRWAGIGYTQGAEKR